VLTEAGLASGAQHKPAIPDLDRRMWLIFRSGKEERKDWRLNDGEPLPAPVWQT
jgi:hypothetical protein